MAIRVLLVGRHEELLGGLRARLACESDLVVHIHTAGVDCAEACLSDAEFDVVVVDGDCPLDVALVFVRKVRSRRPSCAVLLIESTQIAAWRDVDCSSLLAGLIGRQDLPHCLPEAVRIVGEKGTYLSPEVSGHVILTDGGLRYPPASASQRCPPSRPAFAETQRGGVKPS